MSASRDRLHLVTPYGEVVSFATIAELADDWDERAETADDERAAVLEKCAAELRVALGWEPS